MNLDVALKPIGLERPRTDVALDAVREAAQDVDDSSQLERTVEEYGGVVEALKRIAQHLSVLNGFAGLAAAVAKACGQMKACHAELEAIGSAESLKLRLEDELRYLQEVLDRLQRALAAASAAGGPVEVDRTMEWLDSIVTPLEQRVADLRERVAGYGKNER